MLCKTKSSNFDLISWCKHQHAVSSCLAGSKNKDSLFGKNITEKNMIMERKAHSSGTTSIQFDVKSDQILTSGCDGKVTVWDNLDDEEQLKTFNIGGQLEYLALRGDMFYTVNEKGNGLVGFTTEDGQNQGLITRFTAKITCITSNSTHVAAGASDFKIRVVNLENDVSLLSGHDAPILSLSLAPKSGHLLSASCDGTVKLWIFKTKCCLLTLNLLPKFSDVSLSPSVCGTSWHCDGVEFAVPVDKSLHIYGKDTDEVKYTLSDESVIKPINLCAYSRDGGALAAATVDGVIIVWNSSKQTRLCSQETVGVGAITSLTWYNKYTLLYANDQGHFGNVKVDSLLSEDAGTKKSEGKLTNQEIADMFDGSDDENFMDTEAVEDGPSVEYGDIVEELEDEVKHTRKQTKSKAIEDDDDDDDIASDITGSMATSVAEGPPAETKPAPRPDVTQPPDTPQAGALVTDEQEPFQPGSTPTNHKSRYMVWNEVGIIRSYNGEDESTIDIEFHDTSRHHTIHLNNTDGHSMAALGDECAVLATEDNGKGRSSLLCICYGGDDDKQQWSITLDKHETIQSVCVGGDFVAVATSSHMIRAFTTAGFQLSPFLIPGAPVAMAAYKRVLMVVYHTAPALNGYQNLSVSILTVTGSREVLTHCSKLPLSGTSTLQWLGFSSEGTPLIYDSNGLLSMYRIFGHDLWTPIINTKVKDKHSSQFIVSVAEVPPQIRCISCKGSSYPSTSIKPTMRILNYCIPLAGLDTDTGVQEEIVWRHRLLSQASGNWLSDRIADTTGYDKQEQTSLMKLFSTACREERLDRAYQIAGLMCEGYVKLAAQYANRTHNVSLAKKLQQLAQEKKEGTEEESVFGIVQPTVGFSGYNRITQDDEESTDELTRFTAARFSTTPSKELTTSIITSHGASQHSPLIGRDDSSQSVPVSGTKNARLTFANVLSQPPSLVEDSQQSQDSQSSRSNPFKRMSDGAPKRLSINDMHKALDEKDQQKAELKKNLAQQHHTVKQSKQTKLFAKSADTKTPADRKSKVEAQTPTDENMEKGGDKPMKVPKMSAFELFRKEKCEGKSRAESMDQFKSISREEKKVYVAKADAINKAAETPSTPDDVSEKKRKLNPSDENKSDSEPNSVKKQALVASENTKAKLAAFANN